MKISTAIHDTNYKILSIGDIQIHFTEFEKENTGVRLILNRVMVAYLYFEDATEFYKAWRAM